MHHLSRAAALLTGLALAQAGGAFACVGWRAIGVFSVPGTAAELSAPWFLAITLAWSALPSLALAAAVGVLGWAVRSRLLRLVLAWPAWVATLAGSGLLVTRDLYRGEGSGGTWSWGDHVVGAVLPASPVLVLLGLAGAVLAAVLPPGSTPASDHSRRSQATSAPRSSSDRSSP